MKSVFPAALAAVLTFALASVSFADPTLMSVSPSQGTVGTQLTITGAELGTAAPKAVLKLHGDATAKAIPLKLARPFDGTTLHATVVKCQPGVYDVIVTPRGGAAVTLDSAFTGQAPAIEDVRTNTIAPGDVVLIDGFFFGTKKGRVTIGGIPQKVKAWTDQLITIAVSKRNRPATQVPVSIFGRGGTEENGETVNVVAPLGRDHFTANFDVGADLRQSNPTQTFAVDNVGTFVLQCTKLTGKGLGTTANSMTVTVGAALNEGTFTAGQILVIFSQTKIGNPLSYSSQGAAGWTITITRRVGSRVGGTFSGGLAKTTGTGPDSLSVTGDFTLTIK